jgi:hypothetical protein
MSEWVSTLLRWESALAKPGLQHLRSSGAHGDGGPEYTPNNSSWLDGDEAVFAGRQGLIGNGSADSPEPARNNALRGHRVVAASGYGADVRIGLRRGWRAACDSALEARMDGQPSADGVSGIANIRFQRVRTRDLQRAGNS